MQKSNIKASILIWATFLSLIITVTFISVSTKINKNLKENKELYNSYQLNNELTNLIKTLSINGNLNSTTLSNGDKLLFETTPFKLSLNENETINIKLETSTSLIISNIVGGPIYYSGTTNTGVIDSIKSYTTGGGNISLQNLGGYSQLSINNTDLIKKYTNYQIIRSIGNKKIIRYKGKIKNF